MKSRAQIFPAWEQAITRRPQLGRTRRIREDERPLAIFLLVVSVVTLSLARLSMTDTQGLTGQQVAMQTSETIR